MSRDGRRLYLLLTLGIGLLITPALVSMDRGFVRLRPPEPPPGGDGCGAALSCLKDLRLAGPPPDSLASLRIDARDSPGFADAEFVETHDLATMPPGRLRALAGRRARFRVLVNCLLGRDGDSFNVTVRDGADLGTVELPASEDIEDGMVVEGVLRVVDHPAEVVNGVASLGFTEYRVVEARRVRP
jgi:hypothetical protein